MASLLQRGKIIGLTLMILWLWRSTLFDQRGVRTHLHMTFSIRLNSKTTLLWFLLTFEGYLVSTSTAFYPRFVEMRTSSNLSQMLNRINSFSSLMMANIWLKLWPMQNPNFFAEVCIIKFLYFFPLLAHNFTVYLIIFDTVRLIRIPSFPGYWALIFAWPKREHNWTLFRAWGRSKER